MSDTPQTDNAPKFYFGDNRPSMETECVTVEFARKLERQRNELLDALENALPMAMAWSVYYENAPQYGNGKANEYHVDIVAKIRAVITKAKEPLL